MRTEIIISDLDRRVEPHLLDETAADRWRAIPYEADGVSGVMLGSGGGARIPHLEIRLEVTGCYRIWLGLHGFLSSSRLRVRLSGDVCSDTLSTPQLERISLPVLHETRWREADLTGRCLILDGGHLPQFFPGALAYIRLEPIERVAKTPPPEILHPMGITEDGFGIFRELRHNRPEDLLEPLSAIPETSAMKMLFWGAADGDICLYPSRVGSHRGARHSRLTRPADDTYYANLRLWRERGWDPIVTVREYCRLRGWEFQAYVRMEAFATQYPLTLTTGIRSVFFDTHPDLWCRDHDGQPVLRLSYAHPEVQEHMLSLFGEILDYEPDGLCLAFIRGVPLVLYEDIMIERFEKDHGIDPRTLDELDPRWLRFQADVINGFLARVRSLLKPGQRLSAIIPGSAADNARWGLDPSTWVREGLIDDLLPTGQRFTEEDVHVDDPYHLDLEWFLKMKKNDRLRVLPMLYPWQLFGEDYEAWRGRIGEFFDAGADGFVVWDGNSSEDRLSKIKDIGLAAPSGPITGSKAPSSADTGYNQRRLLTMNGFRFDRYHHFEIV